MNDTNYGPTHFKTVVGVYKHSTYRNSSSADEIAFEKLWPSLQKTFDDSAKERLFLLYVQGISEGIQQAVRSIEKRLESKQAMSK